MSFFEKLNPVTISEHLLEGCFVHAVEVVDTIDSTNQCLRSAAVEGTKHAGACLAAETQTAGTGRMGRTWHSVPGRSLTFSFICKNYFPAKPGWMTLGVATALSAAVEAMTPVKPSIKWPNDLYVGNRKLAGILAQAVHSPTGPVVIMGVGLNVNGSPAFEASTNTVVPVSLTELDETPIDRSLLLASILNETDKTFTYFEQGESALVFDAFKKRSLLMGAFARFSWNKEIHEGTVLDHTQDLAIVLDTGKCLMELPGETAELLSFEI